MLPRYERNIPSLTIEESELLRTKTVAVIGCGGLGGYIIEQLARLGIGMIRIIDGDVEVFIVDPTDENKKLREEVKILSDKLDKIEYNKKKLNALRNELGEDTFAELVQGILHPS